MVYTDISENSKFCDCGMCAFFRWQCVRIVLKCEMNHGVEQEARH